MDSRLEKTMGKMPVDLVIAGWLLAAFGRR